MITSKLVKSPKEVIFSEYEPIEKLNRSITDKLEWGEYTDVLYSFLGIFALGIYIFNTGKYSIGKDNIIRVKGKRQWLYSRRYIQKNLTDFLEVSELKEMIEFASIYNTIGNVFPIWPGGNEFKGKSHCYDIPEVFFSNHWKMETIYLHYYLNKSIEDVALTRFYDNSKLDVNNIKTLLSYDKEKYIGFVSLIVDEIKMRNKEIEAIISKNI